MAAAPAPEEAAAPEAGPGSSAGGEADRKKDPDEGAAVPLAAVALAQPCFNASLAVVSQTDVLLLNVMLGYPVHNVGDAALRAMLTVTGGTIRSESGRLFGAKAGGVLVVLGD